MYKRKGLRIIGYIFKAICLTLIFGTIGIFLWRIFSSGDPASVKDLMVNDKLKAAYEEYGEDGLTIYSHDMDNTITSVPGKNYGYFDIRRGLFIEEADQVQVTFRYNNSTIKHVAEDYGLDKVPSRDEDLFEVTLYVAYDLTPDITTDNAQADSESVKFVRYYPSYVESTKKNLYNYRCFIFDGVDVTVTENPVLAVYVDIYYKGDVNYEKDAYGTLIIYDYLIAAGDEKYKDRLVPYKITAADIKALNGYKTNEADSNE